MSLGIFLGWATGKSTRSRALVEGAPSFFGSGPLLRRDPPRKRGDQKSNVPREGSVPARGGTEKEKERAIRGRWGGREVKNHLPAYVMLRVCRGRKEP